ncbi:MAG: Ger(x)C family spore germination protein [Bacillota bacterium]|nr:Ger(x)C family spore germination protein [Bacillota bacterium]
MPAERRNGGRSGVLGTILGLALALGVAGCWDYREPNRVAFIQALAVDQEPDGRVAVTALVDVPAGMAGQGGGMGGGTGQGEGRPWLVQQGSGRTLAEALLEMSKFTGRALTSSQCRAVLFSEEVARGGLNRFTGLLTRWFEYRTSMAILVTKGRARDCLKVESPLERDPVDFLVDLLSSGQQFGTTLNFQLLDLMTQLSNYEREAVIPVVAPRRPDAGGGQGKSGQGQGKTPSEAVEIVALAVFRGDRMVGELGPEDTSYYLMLAGRHRSSFLVLADPKVRGKYVAVRVNRVRRKVETRLKGGRPEVEVRLLVPLELLEIQSTVNYTGRRFRPVLEEAAAKRIAAGCRRVVGKAQRQWQADIFAWGSHFKMRFLTWPDWVRFGWLSRQFPRARVKVAVSAKVRRPGTTLQPTKPVPAPSGSGAREFSVRRRGSTIRGRPALR